MQRNIVQRNNRLKRVHKRFYRKAHKPAHKHAYKPDNLLPRIATKLLAFFAILLLAFGAIKAGTAIGNFLYDYDFKIISEIDTSKYKSIINSSLPIIHVTYNSGSVGNPFTAQVRKFMRLITGFDLSMPVTILNSQASYFNLYYSNNYVPMLMARNETGGDKEAVNDGGGIGQEDTVDTGDQGNDQAGRYADLGSRRSSEIVDEGRRRTGQSGNNSDTSDDIILDENGLISYYYYEGEEEKLEEPKENIVSDQKIEIQNMTNLKIDVEALLKEPLNIKFSKSGPQILIMHTHTTESFIKKLEDVNKTNIANWSLDPEENVVRVGHELAELLRKKYGYEVLHNGTVHDYPNYDNAYTNAYKTITSYLKSYPSIKIVFDIHRDGLSKNQPKLRLTTKIDGKDVAKIMFVVGTNAKRSDHPNWKENLKLALKLQESLNKQYPGLARHVYISNNVYNQNLTTGSLIIEIGGDGNLLSECLESVKYLAKAIDDVIKENGLMVSN